MTVKRQLTLLISLIICLPVFTALIIYGYYCNSSKRLLLNSYRRSPEKADVSLTSDDLNSIKKFRNYKRNQAMLATRIRPVSDLRNKYPEVESEIEKGADGY